MSLRVIYNALLAGQKVAVECADEAEAERLRVYMFQYKSRQEKAMLVLGMITEEEKPVLHVAFDKDKCELTFSLGERKIPKQYKIKILDEGDGSGEERNDT